jgi:hypothetical protein
MVKANLRLVVSMAKRYTHRGLPLADVIQDGNLGLIEAVQRFDHARGNRISTLTWGSVRAGGVPMGDPSTEHRASPRTAGRQHSSGVDPLDRRHIARPKPLAQWSRIVDHCPHAYR